MPVTNDNYDQLKIDKLKHYLESQAERGQAKPFEIFVDNLKVVSKTDDPKDFDTYEFYMNEDTEKVRILIYNSNLSPRNDQYCFMVQRNKTGSSLNGLGDIESIVQEKLALRDREHEMNRLKEELEEVKQELADAEEHAEKLENELIYIKENRFKLNNIDLGALASVVFENTLRRNTQLLAKIPGAESFAGIIDQDNKEQEGRLQHSHDTADTEASFQRKEASGATYSENQVQQLNFLSQLQAQFNQKQVDVFNAILGRLAHEPAKLQEIAALLDINY